MGECRQGYFRKFSIVCAFALNAFVLGGAWQGAIGQESLHARPAANVDIENIVAFLPDDIEVAFEEQSYDPQTGYTKLTNVRMTGRGGPNLGVAFGELIVAGFNDTFIADRKAGKNFAAGAVIIDHLDIRDISLIGVEQILEDFDAASREQIKRLEFQIDRILIDDFSLRPFELFAANTEEEVLGDLQLFASYTRAMGAKTISVTGFSWLTEMVIDGEDNFVDISFASSELHEWRGGDFNLGIAKDIVFDIKVPDDDTDNPFYVEVLEGALLTELSEVRDLRLDKVLYWAARNEMPPVSETDLMSLGVWRTIGQEFNYFGSSVFSIESSVTDASNFHWLIPTKLTSETDNLVSDHGKFAEVVSKESVGEGVEFLATFFEVQPVLEKYDLSALTVDMDFDWTWDPSSGEGSLTYLSGWDGYGTMALDIFGAVPDFNTWVKEEHLLSEENALTAFLSENFSLNGMKFQMEDRGGNPRLFEASVELSQYLKEDSEEWEVISNYDIDTLKLLVSSGVIGMAAPASGVFPPIIKYAEQLGEYLTEGGIYTISLNPETPIKVTELQQLAQDASDDVEQIVERLGLDVAFEPR